jgi:hypothetical protein
MLKKSFLLVALVFLVALMGCASGEKNEPEDYHQLPHSHMIPFTEVMGDYHVRLEVQHKWERMLLIFEDITEDPVKLVDLRSIKGEVTMPDNTVTEVLFLPERSLSSKNYFRRLAGIYVNHGEWLKTTPAFTLHVNIPFEGEGYHLTFDYKAPKR